MKLLVLSWFDDKKQKVPHKSVLNFKKVPHKNVIYFVITINFSIIRGKRMLGSIYLKQKYGLGIVFFVNLRICFKEKRGITLKKIMPLFVFATRFLRLF